MPVRCTCTSQRGKFLPQPPTCKDSKSRTTSCVKSRVLPCGPLWPLIPRNTHMGGCQNYCPFLGPYYNTAPNIESTQKGTILLTTTHMDYTAHVKQVVQCKASGSLTPKPHRDWSKFPIVRGPIFGFPCKYGALYKFPPFWEQ